VEGSEGQAEGEAKDLGEQAEDEADGADLLQAEGFGIGERRAHGGVLSGFAGGRSLCLAIGGGLAIAAAKERPEGQEGDGEADQESAEEVDGVGALRSEMQMQREERDCGGESQAGRAHAEEPGGGTAGGSPVTGEERHGGILSMLLVESEPGECGVFGDDHAKENRRQLPVEPMVAEKIVFEQAAG
jgi:hypothetical protein